MSEQIATVGLWKINWQSSDYRKKLITGLILISFILLSLPFFYQDKEMVSVLMIICCHGCLLMTSLSIYLQLSGQ
jgi:predicted MFS family arabinose efflux permease